MRKDLKERLRNMSDDEILQLLREALNELDYTEEDVQRACDIPKKYPRFRPPPVPSDGNGNGNPGDQ